MCNTAKACTFRLRSVVPYIRVTTYHHIRLTAFNGRHGQTQHESAQAIDMHAWFPGPENVTMLHVYGVGRHHVPKQTIASYTSAMPSVSANSLADYPQLALVMHMSAWQCGLPDHDPGGAVLWVLTRICLQTNQTRAIQTQMLHAKSHACALVTS